MTLTNVSWLIAFALFACLCVGYAHSGGQHHKGTTKKVSHAIPVISER